jgi:hypothetical protein
VEFTDRHILRIDDAITVDPAKPHLWLTFVSADLIRDRGRQPTVVYHDPQAQWEPADRRFRVSGWTVSTDREADDDHCPIDPGRFVPMSTVVDRYPRCARLFGIPFRNRYYKWHFGRVRYVDVGAYRTG